MSFLKKFIYKVLSIQEKFLTMRLQKTIGVKNVSKHKKITQAGCLLTLDSIAETEKNKMEEEFLKPDYIKASKYKKKEKNIQRKISNYKPLIKDETIEITIKRKSTQISKPLGYNTETLCF